MSIELGIVGFRYGSTTAIGLRRLQKLDADYPFVIVGRRETKEAVGSVTKC